MLVYIHNKRDTHFRVCNLPASHLCIGKRVIYFHVEIQYPRVICPWYRKYWGVICPLGLFKNRWKQPFVFSKWNSAINCRKTSSILYNLNAHFLNSGNIFWCIRQRIPGFSHKMHTFDLGNINVAYADKSQCSAFPDCLQRDGDNRFYDISLVPYQAART